jgi:hypothetical protein
MVAFGDLECGRSVSILLGEAVDLVVEDVGKALQETAKENVPCLAIAVGAV